MQTILGAGGAIGTELAKALKKYTDQIRLVNRKPKKTNPDDELLAADLLNANETKKAVDGSSVVYLAVGLSYNAKIWEQQWPVIMQNVIDACVLYEANLVFIDNMYLYDPDFLGQMTETTPIKPSSKKGHIRARIANMVMDKVESGELDAMIVRCADYYGPSIKNTSLITETVFNNIANGKPAYWLGSANFKHSFTYTPDAGKATALLGNTDHAFNQVWHLPTASPPLTGREWIEMISAEFNTDPKSRVIPKFIVRFMGLFMPVMRETVEMMYQYERDYVFDSSKFENQFDFTPTSYADGILHIVQTDYRDG